jgi:hypothetical protein
MSTRSRTKSVSATKNGKSQPTKDSQSQSTGSRARSLRGEDHMSEMEKENKTSRGKAKTKAANHAQNSQVKEKSTFCLCHQPDDGTPMVSCSVCDEWCVYAVKIRLHGLTQSPCAYNRYHFRCVNLSEEEASELRKFPLIAYHHRLLIIL